MLVAVAFGKTLGSSASGAVACMLGAQRSRRNPFVASGMRWKPKVGSVVWGGVWWTRASLSKGFANYLALIL